jgi:hypothetical protein
VREGVKLDTALTIIAAFSFLLHFGLVGALYSDWSDPIVDESVTIGELVHLSPMLAPASETLPTETVPDTRPETKKDPAPHDAHDVTPGKHDPSGPSRDTGKRAREEAMARDAKAMGIGILASFGGGSAVDEALTRSQIPVVDLGDAAKADVAVSRGGDDLHLAGDRLVAPSSTHGLQGIAGAKGAGGDGKGKEVEVKPPPATETKIDPIGSTTPVPNAERTISLLRPAFRRCYNRGLQVDPGMAGSVTVRAKIASNGEVAHVEAAQLVGLSSDVSACITKVVQGAQFDSPGPSGSTLDIPVKMIQQAR